MTGEALVALTLSGLRQEVGVDGCRRDNVAPCFVETTRVRESSVLPLCQAPASGEPAALTATSDPVFAPSSPRHPCFSPPQVCVCHGPYPKKLVEAWHAWDKKNGSENEAVDQVPSDSPSAAAQLYLVLAMADSGCDLEKHKLSKGMEEAKAILTQVRGLGL